jgi:hypothetical protein
MVISNYNFTQLGDGYTILHFSQSPEEGPFLMERIRKLKSTEVTCPLEACSSYQTSGSYRRGKTHEHHDSISLYFLTKRKVS